MERELYVQALLTEGERILYAGSLHGAEERAEGTVRRVDLKGRALLPAFVDAHSHLTAYANTFLQAGLGECASWEELGRRLSAFAAREGLAPGEWVRGEGYDHNELAEGRHPARQLLDAACPGHPVMIQHRSGHVGVFNTLALERLGVNEETPCPPGGRMERGPDGKLTGYMEENAFLELQKRVPLPDTEDLLAAYDKAQRSYASYGVATVQEGMMPDQLIPLYRQLLERDQIFLDRIQVQMATAREFLILIRLRNQKGKDVFSYLDRIEKSLKEQGFDSRRADEEDIKRILAVYYEQNVTSEKFEDFDGARWIIPDD